MPSRSSVSCCTWWLLQAVLLSRIFNAAIARLDYDKAFLAARQNPNTVSAFAHPAFDGIDVPFLYGELVDVCVDVPEARVPSGL